MSESENNDWNVARYLATRLEQLGVDRMFGVPGNHLGPYLSIMQDKTNIKWVGCTNEINGGFAADGYARIKGLGVAGVTYGVGALSLINTIGGAFVEHVPLLVINASPTNEQWLNYQSIGLLTSHMSPNRESNLNAYRQVTSSAQVINNGSLAPAQIDAALEICLTELRPVYLEVRQNVWESACEAPMGKLSAKPRPITQRNRDMTQNAVTKAVERIQQLGMPILWGGVEINRFKLADKFKALAEATGIPFCSTIMGKSIVSENHPQFLGVYNGNASLPIVRTIFKDIAKCRIGLGAWTTSKNLGGTQDLGEDWIKADHEGVSVGSQYFPEVRLEDFIDGLREALVDQFCKGHFQQDYYALLHKKQVKKERKIRSLLRPAELEQPQEINSRTAFWNSLSGVVKQTRSLSYDSFIHRINHFLLQAAEGEGVNATSPYQVVADAGFSLLSAQNLTIVERDTFHSQASWLSIGYSAPAATGLSEGNREKRTMVFIGDGAFQETCQSLSSHTRLGHNTVVWVFNNDGFYGIEQMLVEPKFYMKEGGDPYKDFYNVLHPWQFSKLAEVFGNEETPMRGRVITTHAELEKVLTELRKDRSERGDQKVGPMLVQVVVPLKDYPASIGYKVPDPA